MLLRLGFHFEHRLGMLNVVFYQLFKHLFSLLIECKQLCLQVLAYTSSIIRYTQ